MNRKKKWSTEPETGKKKKTKGQQKCTEWKIKHWVTEEKQLLIRSEIYNMAFEIGLFCRSLNRYMQMKEFQEDTCFLFLRLIPIL